jgi:Co/Zn/Cd efflux system component
MYEAYLRFLAPQPIIVLGTVAFASIAMVMNIIASRILNKALYVRYRWCVIRGVI